MASRQSHLELPRRISGYFLLFFAAGMLWLAVGAALVFLSAERRRADEFCRDRLERACSQVRAKDLRQAKAGLQTLIDRFQSEGDLQYCAIVSTDGEILAHSSPAMVGQVYQEPAAPYAERDGVERLRLQEDPAEPAMVEYRAPLRDGKEEVATLHMAFREPELWDAAPGSAVLALVALGPAVCMVLGATTLRCAVRPLAAIESQLCGASGAVCPAELQLDEVPASGTAALGWNRLVQAQRRLRETSGLEQRAGVALQSASSRHGNSALDSLPDGVALTSREGRITFANRALGAICGAAEGNGGLTGKTIEEVLDLGSRPDEAPALLAPNSHGRTVVADLRSTVQGSPRVLRVARYPYWDPDGRADGSRHVWSVRDITQQHLAAQTRDQFLQTAAHELRTPLATIKAYAETLSLDETIEVADQKEFYNIINSEASRLGRLVEDMLNISSMEAGALSASREEADVGRLVAEVIDKAKPLMEQKKLDLQVALPQKWPKTHLDKDKIAASLVNVLGNAAKYTPAGGHVGLRVSADESKLTIVVEDTGIGISADDLPKITEKFFRSSDPRVRQQPGSGLGLSLVKEVVRLHGGSFEIRSEVNKGTAVKITLPIV